ncbi:nickel insertion protein [Blautia producta]|uniref:nickel insertion protein n=1 Tax=Blautia producta TaxID=33035 RepID=UPI0031B60F28
MKVYNKEGILIIVQIDHLSGEVIGNVIERFYEAGAKNVQVLNSITKKNRPAYMMFIDVDSISVEKVEQLIVKECGSSGWHRINTCHRHTNVSIITKDIKIITKNRIYDFSVRGKIIDDDSKSVRPEYEDCERLRRFLIENEEIYIPIKEINMELIELFHQQKEEFIISESN